MAKNNLKEQILKMEDKNNHFSIRKLTIGAASVMIGTTLFLGNNNSVAKADTLLSEQSVESTQKTEVSASADKTDQKDVANVDPLNETENTTSTTSSDTSKDFQDKNTTVVKNNQSVSVSDNKNEQKTDSEQVKNTLNIINSENNNLLSHYDWVGNKPKNDKESTIANSDSIAEDITNMIQSLGYETDEDSEFPWDIISFGETNKTATMFVHPVSQTPAITDTPYFDLTGGDSSIDNVNEVPEPASYISNLGVLPIGTKIEWKVVPTYNYDKDEDGNWINSQPTNDPSIMVTLPGKDPIILDGETLKEVASLPAYGNGTLLTNSDNQVQVGDSVQSPLSYVTNLDQYLASDYAPDDVQTFKDSFKWTVAPNTQKAGYTIGVFTYNDTDGNMILFKVNPITVDNKKTITRTISFTGLPKELVPENVTQVVTYTQKGEQDYVGEPIAWNSEHSSWDEYEVPEVEGYTPNVSKVAAKNVNLDDSDENIIINYVANSHTQIINLVDASTGNKVNDYGVTGKTGETVNVDVTNHVPKNWVIVPGSKVPSQISFGTNDPAPITVYIQHGYKNINNDQTSKTITRIVNLEEPETGKIVTITDQRAKLTRSATLDLVTGEVTYGAWDSASFDAVPAPNIKGYTVKKPFQAPKMKVTGNTKNSVVTFRYSANSTVGNPLIQPDKPAFEGGVAGIPLTQPDKPAFEGGVAGTPLIQPDKPAFEGGVAGIPLVEKSLPEYNGPIKPSAPTKTDIIPNDKDDDGQLGSPLMRQQNQNEKNGSSIDGTEVAKNGSSKRLINNKQATDAKTLPQTSSKNNTILLQLGMTVIGLITLLAFTNKKKN